MYHGRDAFVCLPTGYGKSLCYQALPFVMDHKRFVAGLEEAGKSCVLVVSPLVALMEDQDQCLHHELVHLCIGYRTS